MMGSDAMPQQISIVRGLPLEAESGIGAVTIPGYLREVTTRFADREALVMHTSHGVERWSYAALWEKSVAVAKALIAGGVAKDSRVGILMTNRPEFLSALFGTSLAGGVAVVFSTFSTALELEQLLRLSAVSVLLFEGSVLKKHFGNILLEMEPQIRTAEAGELQSTRFPFLRRLVQLAAAETKMSEALAQAECFENWDDFLRQGSNISADVVDERAAAVQPADAGGLFFSSGTTSLPKGILHAQRSFALQWWRYPRLTKIEGAVRSWTGNGFFWSANISMTVGIALSTGGTVVLQPYFEPEKTLDLIAAERISYISGRPHQWARLLEANNWGTADLSSLRYITRSDLLKSHPTINTDWVMPMGYGNTETMSICTSIVFNTGAEEIPGSFGMPAPGSILKIVDPESGAIVPRGVRGEIHIKGPTLMLGYIGKTGEQTFDEDGYFPTGDGGYVGADGSLYWEGRLTEIIKTGGANVSPIEIDEALALYPGVRRAQTVGVPHETLGEMVVSCVVANEGIVLDAAAIASFLKQRLASFKLPKEILFFKDEEIDVTGSGKVKVAQLRELVAARLSARAKKITGS